MKNVKNVKNTKKISDKKMVAILSAAITATVTMAAVTIIAVAGSSNKIDSAKPTASTVSAQSAQFVRAAEVQNTQEAVNTENKEDVKTAIVKAEDTQKTEIPAVQAQAPAAQQNAVQVQAPAAQQNTEAAPVVQAQAPVSEQKAEAPAVQKSNTPVIPEGEVNDWKTHNAKDGFPIGSYICGNKTLNVVKLDNVNYAVTVTVPVGENSAIVYNIKAYANGNKMTYTNGTKNEVTYDANRNISDVKIVDSNHQGTLDASDAGYTWTDTEGTTVFAPWMEF